MCVTCRDASWEQRLQDSSKHSPEHEKGKLTRMQHTAAHAREGLDKAYEEDAPGENHAWISNFVAPKLILSLNSILP